MAYTYLVCLLLISTASSETYYVTPSANTPCVDGSRPCMTLSWYATRPDSYFTSNTTLILLPGNHSLDSDLDFNGMSNIAYLQISASSPPADNTVVSCSQTTGFRSTKLKFEDIRHVRISNIMFIGCMGNNISSADEIVITDSIFDGQSLFWTGLELKWVRSITISRSSFLSNTGTGYTSAGGAIVVNLFYEFPDGLYQTFFDRVATPLNGYSYLTITNCTFTGNTADFGGALYLLYSIANIHDSTFTGNRKRENVRVDSVGGAIGGRHSNVTIASSTFVNNRANSGGAVGVRLSNVLITSNSIFINNSANEGGAVYIRDISNVTTENSEFIDNRADGSGGAVYAGYDSRAEIINNSTFINNVAYRQDNAGYTSGQGGAVFVFRDSVLMSDENMFYNNLADRGGAVCIDGGNASIGYSMFMNNSANVAGGAVYSHDGRLNALTLQNSIFINNRAISTPSVYSSGGALATSNTIVTSDTNTFINNTAYCCGGAVRLFQGESVIIINGVFANNTAALQDGGSIYFSTIRSSSVNIIANVSFINNTAGTGTGGAIYVHWGSSVFLIEHSTFIDNRATTGSAVRVREGYGRFNVTVSNCAFIGNTASIGRGALYVSSSITTIVNGTFTDNKADIITSQERISTGAALSISRGSATIEGSLFSNNRATCGGAVSFFRNTAVINSCTFSNNTAVTDGGALSIATSSSVTIEDSEFTNNNAGRDGGVIDIQVSTLEIDRSTFVSNVAQTGGGVLNAGRGQLTCKSCNDIVLGNSSFALNTATVGAVINVQYTSLTSGGYLNIHGNIALDSGIIYMSNSTASISGTTVITHNSGSVFVFNSNVQFGGNTTFMNNTQLNNGQQSFQEGGAVTSFQSEVTFVDTANLMYNKAFSNGGAISATESKLFLYGDITINQNYAVTSGGGIYTYQSELNFRGSNYISSNTAGSKGGGVYSVSSTTRLFDGSTFFIGNDAKQGGGICMELNAKLYVVKSDAECTYFAFDVMFVCIRDRRSWLRLEFNNNSADYGGALYVEDDTISGTCGASPGFPTQSIVSECLLQNLALHSNTHRSLNLVNIHFTDNRARQTGGTIFGGLLDRCTVSPFAEFNAKYENTSLDGISYIVNVTDIDRNELSSGISSNPVRVCFCKDNVPDCSYTPPTKFVTKGQMFTVSLVAVDQVNNTVPSSTIRGSLSSRDAGLREGQSIQATMESCTNLEYSIVSPHNSEMLLLYAEGPCNNTGISQNSVQVEFLPCQCPIGFELFSETNCECVCDSSLSPFITTCVNESLLREGDFWITYYSAPDLNDSGLYIYPNCPFDYCFPSTQSVYINLNIPSGSDAQCAFNRAGKLCGACQDGLSLALGSSRCIECNHYWLAILIPFAIAGVVLVAFLMIFNLTVAVGTLSGLIFYANIIAANRAIFIPPAKPNVLSVFIAWLNLDFGFETCFYAGMDGYAKVWLQFAFPLYVIFLVAMIIIISEHSPRFSRLLYNRNPVAVLATLILLSYTKLLRTIIAALSFTTLDYSDDFQETVWLYDSNVPYLEGKHIPLFAVALFTLVTGLIYTLLLFFWQWLLRCPNRRSLKWITNTRLYSFMDTYHAPYTVKHRYWAGLLLLVRIVLYLIAALNVLGDPRIQIVSIICVLMSLFLLNNTVGGVYKRWPLNLLENSFIFNLAIFAALTFYQRETDGPQDVLAYISVGIAFVTFLGIIVYHVFEYIFKKVQERLGLKFKSLTAAADKIQKNKTTKQEPSDMIIVNPMKRKKKTETQYSYPETCSVTEIDGTPGMNNDEAHDDGSLAKHESNDDNYDYYDSIQCTATSSQFTDSDDSIVARDGVPFNVQQETTHSQTGGSACMIELSNLPAKDEVTMI